MSKVYWANSSVFAQWNEPIFEMILFIFTLFKNWCLLANKRFPVSKKIWQSGIQKIFFVLKRGWSILFTCLIWINCLCASCFEIVHTCINTMKKNAVSLHCWDFGVTPFITICLNWRFDLFSISKSVVLFMSYLGSKVPRWKRQLSTYLVT